MFIGFTVTPSTIDHDIEYVVTIDVPHYRTHKVTTHTYRAMSVDVINRENGLPYYDFELDNGTRLNVTKSDLVDVRILIR